MKERHPTFTSFGGGVGGPEIPYNTPLTLREACAWLRYGGLVAVGPGDEIVRPGDARPLTVRDFCVLEWRLLPADDE